MSWGPIWSTELGQPRLHSLSKQNKEKKNFKVPLRFVLSFYFYMCLVSLIILSFHFPFFFNCFFLVLLLSNFFLRAQDCFELHLQPRMIQNHRKET